MSQKQAQTMHNSEAGFMGLEGMGTILFYLIMLAGATLLIVQLFSTSKVVKTATALSAMRVEIKHIYITQNHYGTEDNITKLVADAGAFPHGYTLGRDGDGDYITSLWNTPIRVKTVADGKRFSITVEKVPAEYVIRLATYDLTSWYRIDVGGAPILNLKPETGNPIDSNNVHNALVNLGNADKDSVANVRFYSE